MFSFHSLLSTPITHWKRHLTWDEVNPFHRQTHPAKRFFQLAANGGRLTSFAILFQPVSAQPPSLDTRDDERCRPTLQPFCGAPPACGATAVVNAADKRIINGQTDVNQLVAVQSTSGAWEKYLATCANHWMPPGSEPVSSGLLADSHDLPVGSKLDVMGHDPVS